MAAMVKSVEFIEYTFTTTSGDVSLTQGQDYANCIPFMTLHGATDQMNHKCTDIYFGGTTESGVITFERAVTNGTNTYIKCYVVEFEPTEIRVQSGEFNSLPGGVTTAYDTTVSGFDQTKTAMVHYWTSTSSAQYWAPHLVRGRVLSNGTQVDMYRNHTSGSVSGHYFLFEDISSGNDHLLVDHQNGSFTGSTIYFIIPEAQRDLTRTFPLGSFASSDTSAYSRRQTTRIIPYFNAYTYCDRGEAVGTVWVAVQHVTFKDTNRVYIVYQTYPSFSSGVNVLNQTWSRTCNQPMSSIVSTMPMGISRGSSTTVAEIDQLFCSMKVTGGTSATLQKNSTGYSTYPTYAVIDWGGAVVSTGTNPSPIDPDISFVKSVENFRVTNAVYYEQHDLSKGQDVSNCVVFSSQRASSGGSAIRIFLHNVLLREPGVVVVKRIDATGNGIVDVSVVEFYPDQVKVQTGVWEMNSTGTENAVIEPVSSLDRAFVLSTWESNDSTWWSRNLIRSRFTTTSGVEFYRNDTGNRVDGTFFVVEDLQDNFRVSHSIGSTTGTVVNHWDYTPNAYHQYFQCLPLASVASDNDNYYTDRNTARAYQTGDGSRVIVQRNTGTGTMWVSIQFVRFLDGRDHTHPYAPTMNTSTNTLNTPVRSIYLDHKDISLTTYNPMMGSTCRGDGTGSDDMRGVFVTYRLINSNADVEASRDSAAGMTCYPSYGGVIDWIGYSHPLADEKLQINYAYPTKSLVRSIETFNYEGAGRIIEYYLTKGQIPENCVPFGSWRSGASGNEMDRLSRHAWIDKNSRLTTEMDGSPVGDNLEELWHVVEFDPAQVRVQQIYQLMTGTSYDVDIPIEVDLTKTFMWFTYCTDHYTNQWRYHLVTGQFNSSTQLNFSRNVSSNGIYLTIYLIECLQDQWYCTHQTTGNDADANAYNNVYWKYDNSSLRLIQGSYTIDNANYYCSYSCYRLYPQGQFGYQWNRYTTTGNMTSRHLEVLEFNPKIGVKTCGNFLDFAAGETSETKPTGFVDDLDLERSMALPTIVNCTNRSDSTGSDDTRGITIRLELTDPSTLTDERWNNGVATYGFGQIIQWPAYKTHYFEGVVTERDVPIIRQVACFRSDTNEMMDSTVSASGTGLYHLETTYSGVHYIVCQDDDPPIDYNHLIWGDMEPYPLPTFSGGEIIYG